jgi:hypothetical protein
MNVGQDGILDGILRPIGAGHGSTGFSLCAVLWHGSAGLCRSARRRAGLTAATAPAQACATQDGSCDE